MRKSEDAPGPSDTVGWLTDRLYTNSYISNYNGCEYIDIDILCTGDICYTVVHPKEKDPPSVARFFFFKFILTRFEAPEDRGGNSCAHCKDLYCL